MQTKYLTGYVTKANDIDAGVEFVMSDSSVDRMGDVILPTAWKLDSFKKNPIALYQHDPDDPIGVWENVRVEGNKLLGVLKLAAQDTSDDINAIREMLRQGILRAVSVGFRALNYKNDDKISGVVFTDVELMECSLVSIPANPRALAVAKKYKANEKRIFCEPVSVLGLTGGASNHKNEAQTLKRAKAAILQAKRTLKG